MTQLFNIKTVSYLKANLALGKQSVDASKVSSEHGWPMEEEARHMLQQATAANNPKKGLGSRIHQAVMTLNAPVDLELPPRSLPRSTPDFFSAS